MNRIVVYAFGLVALCIVGAVVLTAMSKTVPTELWAVAFAALTGGAGIAVPATTVAAPAPPA